MPSARRPDELGPVQTRHPVDRARRFTVAFVGAAVSVVFLLCYAALPSATTSHGYSPSAARLNGVVAGGGLVAVLIAMRYLWKALRGGRGEYYEVREHGIVHGTAKGAEAWRWVDIAGVREIQMQETEWRQFLGATYLCRIRLRDGRRFSVTGLTENHTALGAALVEHCPYLGTMGIPPEGRPDGGRAQQR